MMIKFISFGEQKKWLNYEKGRKIICSKYPIPSLFQDRLENIKEGGDF